MGVEEPLDRRRELLLDLLATIVVGVLYFAAARLSLRVAVVGDTVTPVWPPTGIALVAFLLLGPRMTPGISIAAFFVNLSTVGPAEAFFIGLGNTVAPLFSYWLLRRVRFDPALEGLRDALSLVFLGALSGMLLSATTGTLTLWIGSSIAAPAQTWWTWWTGDALGVLVFAPLLLVAMRIRKAGDGVSARALEAATLALGAGATAFLVTRSSLGLLFLVFPFLIWSALRFQQQGAAPIAAIVTLIAVSAAVDGVGPFAGESLLRKMITLQAFNGSVTLTAFLLAAMTSESRRARAELDSLRRRQAMELNDEIVQGLSVAKYALELEDGPTVQRAIDRTLDAARQIVKDLLGGQRGLSGGDLVRGRPAEVGAARWGLGWVGRRGGES